MKKKVFISVAFGILVVASCKKDDPSPKPEFDIDFVLSDGSSINNQICYDLSRDYAISITLTSTKNVFPISVDYTVNGLLFHAELREASTYVNRVSNLFEGENKVQIVDSDVLDILELVVLNDFEHIE